jgi:pimeloyl-ACP methyl ester carboxylesterase
MTKYKPSGRGKAVLALDWSPESLPDGTVIEPHTLIASDGEVSRATLYTLGSPTAVVCLMHPRQDMQRHPLIPHLLEAGYCVWAQASRVVGNDLTLVHEAVLLDVAAGMETLREAGFEHITLCGISGGAGLYSFYTEQSQADARVERTPGGAPAGLTDATMPVPDALCLIAPHPGQGRLLLAMIDGSVTDEADPFSVDRSLDPFDPANGFDEEGSSFAADWMARYREAQRARVQRVDDHARELIAAQRAARKAGDLRRGVLTPVITMYRSDADPRCTDLSLDANDRKYGSVISPKPQVSNYGLGGFGRLTNAESWLSTWSGISSNAAVERCLAGVTVPTLIIEYTGDQSVFPSDIATALAASAADDPQHVKIRSSHFAKRLSREDEDPIPLTSGALTGWLSR